MHNRQHALMGLFLFTVIAGCGGPEASVVISSPSSGPVHVRDTLTLQVAVLEADVKQVELLRNGALLAVIHAPFQYTWDTRAEPEGLTSLVAQARHGEVLLTSAPLEVVVDRTPPHAVSSAPAAWSENAWLSDPVHLSLSEPIDPASLLGPALAFTDGHSVILAEATLSPDGTELIVMASVPPRTGTTWTLELAGLRDLAGNPLSTRGVSWNLPRWQRPSPRMDTDGEYGTGTYAPSVELDSQGTPVIAFVEHHLPYDSCCGRVDARVHVQRWNGASWEALGEQLNAYGDDPSRPVYSATRYTPAFGPSLVLDADDRPIVAWAELTAPSSGIGEVHVSRWNGAGWEPLGGPVGALPGETSASAPSLALTPEGIPMVAFVEAISPDASQIQVRRWFNGAWENLGAPLGIDWTGRIRSSAVTLDVGPEGTIAVAWAQERDRSGLPSSEEQIRVAIWQEAAWYLRTYTGDSAAGTPAGPPHLRVDHHGQPVVAWNERGTGGSRSFVMIASRHAAATPTHLVSGRGDADTSVVGLTIDSREQLFVAWSHESGRRASVERWSGDGWTTLDDQLGSLSGAPFSVADLAVSTDGVVAAAIACFQPEFSTEVVRSSF